MSETFDEPSGNTTNAQPGDPPLRVAVVGAGASGMAAAWSLSRFPARYRVTVIEPGEVAGGVACTLKLPNGTPVNYGVQGGSPAAHANTTELMKYFGVDVGPTKLDVSFGAGGHNWKNYEVSPLQTRLSDETRRFGDVLKWISRFEFITIFLSIEFVLSVLRFSNDFRHRMVYPLVALFFGTGNQTPKVSSAVIARVFLDRSLAIFDYDPERLLRQTPTNIAFDDLEDFYGKVRRTIGQSGGTFLMRTRATRLDRRNGRVFVTTERAPPTWRAGSDQRRGEYPVPGGGARCSPEHAATVESCAAGEGPVGPQVLEFDEVIVACPADAARAMLGEGASFWERRVLPSVQYFDDLTVTHTDEGYMKRHNVVDGRAIYFIRSDEAQPDVLEMGFELTAYQPALQPYRAACGERIYQTIYLDRDRSETWTIGDLSTDKIIDRAWWSAFSHTYQHFRRVVPWVWLLQGHKRTWYAGSWTLFNTHDIAITSGLAAAHRLGAPYPFTHNPTATATFDTVLGTSHLRTRGLLAAFHAVRGLLSLARLMVRQLLQRVGLGESAAEKECSAASAVTPMMAEGG